jgi:MFS family permease
LRFSDYHIGQHQIFRIKNTELNRLYFVMSLRAFVMSLVGIFVPIYLYSLGYGISEIIFYYMVMYFGEACLEFGATLMMKKRGPKFNIAISLPAFILQIFFLWALPIYNLPLWLVAIPGSFGLSFFWQAYHYDFSLAKNAKKAASQISRMYIILAVLGALGPLIGGVVATNFGIGYVYLLVFLGLLVAFIMLNGAKDFEKKDNFSIKKLRKLRTLNQQLAYGSMGIEASVSMVFWPLFIYLIVGSYQSVGIVTSIALVLTVLVTYAVGKKADKKVKSYYIKRGSLLNGLVNIFRTMAAHLGHILFLNVFAAISHSIYTSPFITEYYLHADEESRAEYIALMEFSIDIMRFVFFVIMYILSLWLGIKALLAVALILGAAASFFIGIMPPASRELKNESY